jgi:hypothetical protein
MPKVLPWALMKEHSCPSLASSAGFGDATVNGVSVNAYVGVVVDVFACRLVPHATMPGASVTAPVPTRAADVPHGLVVVPTPAPGGAVATNLITNEVGLGRPLNILFSRSFCTDSETNPFGVIGQEQQDKISSSGAMAYALMQIDPLTARLLVKATMLVVVMLAPSLEMST